MSQLERLERLEQSITLALYEIDANFAKCNRTVSTRILPVVENYAKSCNNIWESSKFWKQFFEASASVSLSGVEEPVQGQEKQKEDFVPSDLKYMSSTDPKIEENEDTTEMFYQNVPSSFRQEAFEPKEVKDEQVTQSTPKKDTTFENLSLENASLTPIPARLQTPARKINTANPQHTGRSALLHRVLDTNWHVQVTPHERKKYEDMDIDSSPLMSPSPIAMKMETISTPGEKASKSALSMFSEFEHESNDSLMPNGMSPPKTIQFSPHSLGDSFHPTDGERSLSLQRKFDALNDSNENMVKEESWEL
ncbi:DASH complex subunit Ask1 [Schizosaccharomyces octosporus yFS286]|uniref:DASH complex subunit ASK1 n=1 Tax=Schizosaccharomyces octosporus (strain yFS286) TaxID=483514 RepID=S9R1F3_SCHOY|nr:DASH complex subunit Ask1 [Schizosaccharomyces octosporus yFS286]EPX72250.1 DASH complex subunit Ask1 [Schizosaccharomyces octosporus yFS286]